MELFFCIRPVGRSATSSVRPHVAYQRLLAAADLTVPMLGTMEDATPCPTPPSFLTRSARFLVDNVLFDAATSEEEEEENVDTSPRYYRTLSDDDGHRGGAINTVASAAAPMERQPMTPFFRWAQTIADAFLNSLDLVVDVVFFDTSNEDTPSIAGSDCAAEDQIM